MSGGVGAARLLLRDRGVEEFRESPTVWPRPKVSKIDKVSKPEI